MVTRPTITTDPARGYRSGQKNNWRRRVWNLLLANMRVPAREARGVFLPGPEILDLAVASSKGFRPENLTAIEIKGHLASSLRRQWRCPVVHEVIDGAVLCWPESDPLDFIIADYCGTLNQAQYLRDALLCSRGLNRRGCVLIINLLRGREQGYWADVARTLSSLCPAGLTGNRAFMFASNLNSYAEPLGVGRAYPLEFGSYRSGNLRMDWGCVGLKFVAPEDPHPPMRLPMKSDPVVKHFRRRLAAARAVYSMNRRNAG